MADMLTHSSIVPENYRGDEHLGDCVIALEIANRIGASILAVMQNLRLVQGKPGWSSQFLISCVNASKRFSPIRYQMTGTRGEDSWGCIAWAVDKTGEVLKSPAVTIQMAKEEGWFDRAGSKWRTMPELMLCYRSATLFTRLYAPEITMGIQTTEEIVETGPEGNGHPNRPRFEALGRGTSQDGAKAANPGNGAPRQLRVRQLSAASDTQLLKAEKAALVAPENSAEAVPDSGPPPEANAHHYNHLKALTGLIRLSRHSPDEVLTFLRNTRRCDESSASLVEVSEKQPEAIVWAHDNWKSLDRELARLKGETT